MLIFTRVPYFRLLGSHNNRISPSIELLHESYGGDKLYINGDYEYGHVYADWYSIFRNWGYYKKHINSDIVLRYAQEIIEQKPAFVVFSGGDFFIPTVEMDSIPVVFNVARLLKENGIKTILYGVWGSILKLSCFKYNLFKYFNGIVYSRAEKDFNRIFRILTDCDGFFEGDPLEFKDLPFISLYARAKTSDMIDYDYIFSRSGCSYAKCGFCLSRFCVYQFDKMHFINELKYRNQEFGVENFYFADLDFTTPEEVAADICAEIIKEGLRVRWVCESRVGVSDDLLRLMKAAGCYCLKLGVEFLREDVLYVVNKGIRSVEDVRDNIKRIKDMGLQVVVYCMLGSPTTDDDFYKKTFSFWQELNADYYCLNITCPYPGTALYDKMFDRIRKFGLDKIENVIYLSHFNTDLLEFWGIREDTFDMYLSLVGSTKKEDSGIRKYERRIL